MQSQYMNFLYYHAAIPVGFLRYVLLCCLSYCLAYASVVVFSKIHRFCSIIISVVCGSRTEVFFAANFCYLTLSSVCWNQGLNFAKFSTSWSCFHYVL